MRLFSAPSCMVGAWLCFAMTTDVRAEIQVSPTAITLDRPEASQQVLVTRILPNGQRGDATRLARYQLDVPGVVGIDETGLLAPLSEGTVNLAVILGDESVTIPVRVTGLVEPAPISFRHEVIPILTKAGCNSGGCHGKAEGQNGFKLSVFGFDVASDYDALVKQARGRRVFVNSPEHSLLLRKSTSREPHGGGMRMTSESLNYRTLLRWIAEGAKFTDDESAQVVRVEVQPAQIALSPLATQQLRVTAHYSDGRSRCVTAAAEYSSNAETLARVDGRGWIEAAEIPGEAAILVRYMGQVAVTRVTMPRALQQFVRPSEANFIDGLVWDKLAMLGIQPSEPADDATWLRRVHLDTIGTLPTAAEARDFLADPSPDKRPRRIDELLAREEYADYWTMLWSDILRVDRDKLTAQGSVALTRWLRRQFVENRPYDEFVESILLAQGSTQVEGPAAIYKVLDTPELLSRSLSQVFLGVRIECAQCHHHPFERWAQDDYFGLAGFFTGISKKIVHGGAEAIVSRGGVDLNHPRTGQPIRARALGAPDAEFRPNDDRRRVLAKWMTSPDNPYLAATLANRLWAHYLGRGLVEPIDDLRATNPAVNEPLLAALARHLVATDFDIREFTRTLLNSRVYQLSSEANSSNRDDDRNFSRALIKALPAEVLLDAICQTTGVREEFNGWPDGYRAIQVWDNRMPSYFFQIFGRPVRASVCECERSNEPSIAQALHLLNSPEILAKLQDRRGIARKLAESSMTADEILDELYLTTLTRFPTAQQRASLRDVFSTSDRRAAVEDVLWALLNSKEFLYNH